MKRESAKDYQYFLNDIPVKRAVWDNTHLWEIAKEEGRSFYHLLYDRLKFFTTLSETINPKFLIAFSILNRTFRYIIKTYFEDKQKYLNKKILENPLYKSIVRNFVYSYPPKIYKKGFNFSLFLKKEPSEKLKKSIFYEMVLLKIIDENPAISEGREIFVDDGFIKNELYLKILKTIENDKKVLGPLKKSGLFLFDLLREPIRHSPNSIYGQIIYIKERWGYLLPEEIFQDIVISLDIIKEYDQIKIGGKGVQEVISFKKEEFFIEPERFSPDTHWMPEVVLLAKLIYVWLYQLSKKYSREIKRLDEIPDEELDLMREWGFNALWLIGIWERSPASKKIKHLMGNISAHSSAYSLYDYVIAEDLGGEEAFNNLKERAFKRGIRLASDMVPNHTGIYSKWVIEHPDWFIQTDYPPFPKYSFTKANLSENPDIEIYIEDGYYDRTDAGVVFKYIDKRDGRVRYIYHGNDGTSTPWNDTAQLNYLLREVREAVIQTILYVAKKTPIIRFDAAMTLTKRHFQRLWFPMPGQGGAIPSRAEFSMPKEVFDALMPDEFWREVVDRVSREAPDTLLLAEAFWLLEGYFVRSLGMHRVYNSAFMNMLKNEENGKYRQIIKNILHFNPEILKRFVNFMSNPDEQTAIEQFGTGDKYLGVCILLVTMPGLPMFAHGQVEGFKEKYGMEFYKAFWDEEPNEGLIELHKRFIFPLMKKRYLFSEAENFYLFDFLTEHGIDEDVFAYSNFCEGEGAIILYNNRYKSTKGYIKISSERMVKNINKGHEYLKKDIFSALNLKLGDNVYYLFENFRNNSFYLRSSHDIYKEGLYFELNAYESVVLINIKELIDTDGTISKIYRIFKDKFFDNFEQIYLENKNEEKLKKINELMEIKLGERDRIFEILSEIILTDITKTEDLNSLKEKVEELVSFLDLNINYRLINLTISDLYLRKFNKNILSFFNEIGAIKLLERMNESNKLYLLAFNEILNNINTLDNRQFLDLLSKNDITERFLIFNNFQGHTYFNKERFEELVSSLLLLNESKDFDKDNVKFLIKSAEEAGYCFDLFVKKLIPEERKETES
ncbi:MAG: alpha-amylase family glycosyl hydrolase [Proteobacteria bacterium]|nr:alpha-amylase family glycosyl hydrolase [Pseudomonadota bacterium]